LPETFKEEARELRNKLLLYRFHRRLEVKLDPGLADPKLEPRLNQILLPLLSVVSDESLRTELRGIKRLNIKAYKSHGIYVVPMNERPKIELLCTRYGVSGISGSGSAV